MLLRRLVDLSTTLGSSIPAFYKVRSVRWQLDLTADGQLAQPELVDLADPTDPARRNGVNRATPYLTRTRAIAPCLGTDSLEYVLGWSDTPERQDWVDQCHTAFANLFTSWAAERHTEPAARAVEQFFRAGYGSGVNRHEGWEPRQVVQLSVEGRAITDLPSAQLYWATEAARRKGGGGTRVGVCLVCGESRALVDTLPQQLNMGLVPLATQNAALVSVNRPIHTYDHSTGLASSVPICMDCAQRSVAALTHVLGAADSHLRFGDSRMAWWTLGAAPLNLDDTLAVHDPETVASLIHRVRRTAMAPTAELQSARFCAVMLAGNVSRVMIRDWIDMPLASVERNIADWFTDHRLEVPSRTGDPDRATGYQPLWLLVLATGRAQKNADGRREYARLDAKNAQRPHDIGRQLLGAAVLRQPLPGSLLAHLVTRIRTDGHLDAPRASLLRLALTRNPTTKENPLPGLDPDNRDPAYLAGRVFADLENLQQAASGHGGSDRAINTTFTDRYFSGAVTNPRVAVVQGRQLATAWMKKLRRSNPGLAVLLDRDLTALFTLFDPATGVPGRLGITGQALFLLGYHHQRADRMQRRIDAATRRETTSPPDSSPTSNITVDPHDPAAATATSGTDHEEAALSQAGLTEGNPA